MLISYCTIWEKLGEYYMRLVYASGPIYGTYLVVSKFMIIK